MANFVFNYIRDLVSPQSLKALNENFENLRLKLFGGIEGKDIQNNTIDTAQIKNAAIDSAKIGVAAIKSAHIDDAQILTAHIGTGQITTALIGNGVIDTVQIADGSVTDAKIVSLTADKIVANTLDTSKVTIQGTNGKLRMANNRLQVFDNQSTPKERVSLGDVNGDGTLYGLRVRGADGTTVLLDENGVKPEGITDGSITNTKISSTADIDGSKLLDNSIAGGKLVVDSITAREIASKTITANEILANTITGNEIAATTIGASKIKTSELIVGNNIAMGTGTVINWGTVTPPDYTQITGSKPPANADNTSSVVGNKLTYIDSSGVYTGQLVAGTAIINGTTGGILMQLNGTTKAALGTDGNMVVGSLSARTTYGGGGGIDCLAFSCTNAATIGTVNATTLYVNGTQISASGTTAKFG